MKRKLLLFRKGFITVMALVFALSLITGCARSSDDEAATPDVLTGIYSLRSFSPGFGPFESYSPNDIIWQFMPDQSLKVTINTTIPANSQLPFTSNTTVTYHLINDESVKIGDITYEISLTENKLILDSDSSSDGKRITFDIIQI